MRQIIAILRGITPAEVEPTCTSLLDNGISQIEIPLNSPHAFDSLHILVQKFGNKARVGAGTVLNVESVKRLSEIGVHMVISPDCNSAVIQETKRQKLLSFPGVFTPTECFLALQEGADGLKFFPATSIGIQGFKAYRAVLPQNVVTYAVGGLVTDDYEMWLAAGVTGFGLGSALYVSGQSSQETARKAKAICEAYDAAALKVMQPSRF